jgi:hypothetical protein
MLLVEYEQESLKLYVAGKSKRYSIRTVGARPRFNSGTSRIYFRRLQLWENLNCGFGVSGAQQQRVAKLSSFILPVE